MSDTRATTNMTPIAWVVGTDGRRLKVRCPYCDRLHLHDIRLGARIAHCDFGALVTDEGQLGYVYYLEISPGLSEEMRDAVAYLGL